MKTSLTLSTILFALTLSPAAFANGAQEQTQESVVENTATSGTSVTVVRAPEAVSVTQSVLERIEADVRQEVLGSLRASKLLVDALQFAAPALVEATGINQKVELTSR
jgi:hypothetical protein